jgi:hypothetical protein
VLEARLLDTSRRRISIGMRPHGFNLWYRWLLGERSYSAPPTTLTLKTPEDLQESDPGLIVRRPRVRRKCCKRKLEQQKARGVLEHRHLRVSLKIVSLISLLCCQLPAPPKVRDMCRSRMQPTDAVSTMLCAQSVLNPPSILPGHLPRTPSLIQWSLRTTKSHAGESLAAQL